MQNHCNTPKLHLSLSEGNDWLPLEYVTIAFCFKVRYTQFKGVYTMAPVYQKNIQYTLASHAIERMRPSNDAIDLMQKMSDGKISADDAVNQLLKKYGISKEKLHG